LALSEPFSELLSPAARVTKALVYCPDAFGTHALERFPVLHERLRRASTHEIELSSVFPPKTPVCFASLFTGGTPEQHGIRRYERPVLSCDTVFDALTRAGKKVAIVAVRDSSIDLIFRKRPIDYFSPTYDPLVTHQALDLLKANEHDVIVVYHQEYDDLLHRTGPFSELATRALEHHVETWELLARAASAAWGQDYVLAFAPDHGGHFDPDKERGDHGEDRPEDMQLRHFFVRA
jgi:hypothetical protein